MRTGKLRTGREWRMRTWWDNFRRCRPGKAMVLGAERHDRSDRAIERPYAHADCEQDFPASIDLADCNAVRMRIVHR